jgi:hypothetical protein
MMMKRAILITFIFLTIAVPAFGEESIVFTGVPEIRISEGGVSRVPETLTKDKAIKFKCTITRVGGKYYWTSRENVELVLIASGAFVTYWAANGSGYVRVVKPEMKGEVKKVGAIAGDPEAKFDYVEHLLLGLKSVTYYGNSK